MRVYHIRTKVSIILKMSFSFKWIENFYSKPKSQEIENGFPFLLKIFKVSNQRRQISIYFLDIKQISIQNK